MKKFLTALFVCSILFLGNAVAEGENSIILTVDQTTAYVFGNAVENDVPPVIRNDRTMIPLRFVAENLGAEVFWDGELKQIEISKSVDELIFTVNSDKVLINGIEYANDSPAFIENDRTYVPVRLICESLGAQVTWDPESKNITIVFDGNVNSNTIVYKVTATEDDYDISCGYLAELMSVRLKSMGYEGAEIRAHDDEYIEVMLPTYGDTEYIVQTIKPKVTFRDYKDNEVLNEKDMDYVSVDHDVDDSYSIALRLTVEGSEKFKEATARISKLTGNNNIIKIMLDDTAIAVSQVTQELETYKVVVSGDFSEEKANSLADQIRLAIMPVALEVKDIH